MLHEVIKMTTYGLIRLDANGREIDVCETVDINYDAENYLSEIVQAADALTAYDDDIYNAYQTCDMQDTFSCNGTEYRIRIITHDDDDLINNSATLSDAKADMIRSHCTCGAYTQTYGQLWKHLPVTLYSLPALTIAEILNAMQERYQAGRASHGGFDICDDCLWVPNAGEKHTDAEKTEMQARGSVVTDYCGMLLPLQAFRTLKIETGVKEHEFDGGYTEVTYKNGKEIRNDVKRHYKGNYEYTRYTIDYIEYGKPVD